MNEKTGQEGDSVRNPSDQNYPRTLFEGLTVLAPIAHSLSRQQVYALIDSERDYQDKRWPRPAHNHSITEYLVYIRDYVESALHQVTHEDGDAGIRGHVRKIAALAVVCLEDHGAPARVTAP